MAATMEGHAVPQMYVSVHQDGLEIPAHKVRRCVKWFYSMLACNTDIDECQIDNGGCVQKCINNDGSHECSCNDGFEMLNDTDTCVGEYHFLALWFTATTICIL